MIAVSRLGEDERKLIVRHHLLDQPVAVVASTARNTRGDRQVETCPGPGPRGDVGDWDKAEGDHAWMTRLQTRSSRACRLSCRDPRATRPGARRCPAAVRHEAQTPGTAGGVRAGVAVLVAPSSSTESTRAPTPARPATESVVAQRIDKFAEQAAANAGDPNITEVHLGSDHCKRSRRDQRREHAGATTPVYLVEIPGSFMLKDVSLAAHARCSTGRVEFLSMDRSSFTIRDWASGASWTI